LDMQKFIIKRSFILLCLLGMNYVGALCCILLVNFAIIVKLISLLLWFFSLVFTCRRYWFCKDFNVIEQLWLDQKNKQWTVITYTGQQIIARMQTSSVVSRYFVLLNFKSLDWQNKKHVSAVVWFDAMSADDFRRFRVIAKRGCDFSVVGTNSAT
jgi:hypothetical protein